MALIRRDNREVNRQEGSEYRGNLWDPFRVMDAFLRLDPLRVENGLVSRSGEFVPRFDVKETKAAYELRADVPGVKEEDIELSLNGNLLTVSGKREIEQREEGDQYFSVERSFGTFSRSFSLPDNVDVEHISADLRTGVLMVQIPKKPEAQPKKISIGKRGSDGGQAKA